MVFAGMAMVTLIAAADTAMPMAITGAIADIDERGYGPFFIRIAGLTTTVPWR